MEPGSWMRAIETKAIANWSCSTAARVVVEFVSARCVANIFGRYSQALQTLRFKAAHRSTNSIEFVTQRAGVYLNQWYPRVICTPLNSGLRTPKLAFETWNHRHARSIDRRRLVNM